MGEMTAVCAANGSWSPDPADVTCREIGMNVLLHRGNCILDMLNDTTDGSNTWPIYQTVTNSTVIEEVASINQWTCWQMHVCF